MHADVDIYTVRICTYNHVNNHTYKHMYICARAQIHTHTWI